MSVVYEAAKFGLLWVGVCTLVGVNVPPWVSLAVGFVSSLLASAVMR